MEASESNLVPDESLLTEDLLQDIYSWVDQIPLSRPKRNISRDFSDGILMAEVVQHFYPRLVDLHNYTQSHSSARKLYNWETLNKKVFGRMGFAIPRADVEAVVHANRNAIERTLVYVRRKMAEYENKRQERQYKQREQLLSNPNRHSSSISDAQDEEIRSSYARPSVPIDGYPHHDQNPPGGSIPTGVSSALIREKDEAIAHFQETVDLLQLKISKLEQLLSLKEGRIRSLESQV